MSRYKVGDPDLAKRRKMPVPELVSGMICWLRLAQIAHDGLRPPANYDVEDLVASFKVTQLSLIALARLLECQLDIQLPAGIENQWQSKRDVEAAVEAALRQ